MAWNEHLGLLICFQALLQLNTTPRILNLSVDMRYNGSFNSWADIEVFRKVCSRTTHLTLHDDYHIIRQNEGSCNSIALTHNVFPMLRSLTADDLSRDMPHALQNEYGPEEPRPVDLELPPKLDHLTILSCNLRNITFSDFFIQYGRGFKSLTIRTQYETLLYSAGWCGELEQTLACIQASTLDILDLVLGPKELWKPLLTKSAGGPWWGLWSGNTDDYYKPWVVDRWAFKDLKGNSFPFELIMGAAKVVSLSPRQCHDCLHWKERLEVRLTGEDSQDGTMHDDN